MQSVTTVLLFLTLLLCGCYAGMTLMCQIGVLPAMCRLTLPAYADAFRAMDFYLDRSMPPYKLTLLAVNLATLVCVALQHRTPLAVAVGAACLLNVVALVLTIRKQLPLSAELKRLGSDAAEPLLLNIREQTVRNFMGRSVVAMIAFIALCTGVLLWPLH